MDNKKKKIAIVGLIALCLVLLAFGTFAWWTTTKKQTNRNLIGSACLNITFSNETGDIALNDAWPTTDSEGAALTPYTFRITNNCDSAVTYEIALESIEANNQEDPSYLNYDYIKVKLDNGRPMIYGNLEDLTNDNEKDYTIRDTKQIGINSLSGHEHADHELRIWLDENTPMEEINKIFISKIKIIGGQGIEPDNCYTIKSDGTITGYNSACGTSATIPATVSGIRVRNIASDAFKNYTYTYGFSNEYNSFEAMKTAEFDNQMCDGENGEVPCTLDFSFAVTPKLAPAFDGQAPAADVTASDIFIIIYNSDPTSPQYSSVESAARSLLTTASSQIGIDTSTSKVYHVGDSGIPKKGISEMYYALEYNSGSWYASEPASRSRATMGSLLINSLDLSQTTYLEKIEPVAFSNIPNNFDVGTDYPVGLTSLVIGDHDNTINIGGGAFAKSDLDSLNLYNNFTTNTVTEDGMAAILGPFGQSTIDNLTIKKHGNNTSFEMTNVLEMLESMGITPASGSDESWSNRISDAAAALIVYAGPVIQTNNLTFDNGITTINYTPIVATTSLNLPNDLTELGTFAFAIFGANFTGTLTLPSTLTTIGEGAFDLYNASNVTIPASVTTIGKNAFSGMDNNKTITVNRAQSGMTLGDNWNGNAHVTFSN